MAESGNEVIDNAVRQLLDRLDDLKPNKGTTEYPLVRRLEDLAILAFLVDASQDEQMKEDFADLLEENNLTSWETSKRFSQGAKYAGSTTEEVNTLKRNLLDKYSWLRRDHLVYRLLEDQ